MNFEDVYYVPSPFPSPPPFNPLSQGEGNYLQFQFFHTFGGEGGVKV